MNARASSAAALVLVMSCASHHSVAPPSVTQLPGVVLEVMCSRLRTEGMSGEVRVVNETQAIITPATVQALASASFQQRRLSPDAIQQLLSTPLTPIEVPAKACSQPVAPSDTSVRPDVMLLQFSPPFVNPFSKGETGTLARLSLGGESATWYWVPLVLQNNRWSAGSPTVLSVME